MVKITKNLSLMAKAACFSTLVFMSSCSKDELIPTPESAVSKDANLRTAVLPTGTLGNIQFKIEELGLTGNCGPNNSWGNGYGAKITQVDPSNTKKGKYGILASTRSTVNGPINPNPEIKFDPLTRMYVAGEFGPGNPLKLGSFKVLEPFEWTETYIRAFILFEDGTVIYSDVWNRDLQGGGLYKNPKLWELKANPVDANGMNVSITKQGYNPAVEYGIVYSYQKNATDPINPEPTVADKRINAYKPSVGSYIGYTPGNSFSAPIDFQYYQLYYRPYVKLENGSIVYGNVAYSHKRPKIVLK
jgi:hypothetical protein